MKSPQSLHAILIISLCLSCPIRGYSSDWKFFKPGFNEGEEVWVERNDVGIVAMQAVLDVLNELLQSNDKSRESYFRWFGIEPESVFNDMGNKETSGFLNCLFTNLSVDNPRASELKLTLESKELCWKLSEDGNYIHFAASIKIRGSQYQRAIMTLRVETQEKSGTKSAFARPSGFYVSVR